jgi:hypothetical protein
MLFASALHAAIAHWITLLGPWLFQDARRVFWFPHPTLELVATAYGRETCCDVSVLRLVSRGGPCG